MGKKFTLSLSSRIKKRQRSIFLEGKSGRECLQDSDEGSCRGKGADRRAADTRESVSLSARQADDYFDEQIRNRQKI